MSKKFASEMGGVIKTVPVSNMPIHELEKRFKYFERRSKSLCGRILVDGKPVGAGELVSGFFGELAKGLNDPKAIAQRNEFLDKVQKNDPGAREQFCALRLETYNNSLYAQMGWVNQYCEIVELAEDERPLVQNTYNKEVKVYYVGGDGAPKMQKIEKDDTEYALPLRALTTPFMRYKVVDLYRGNIVDQAVKTLALARDTANMMESEVFNMVTNDAFVEEFTFNGQRANWPYVANSYIDTDNLPTTNDVQVQNATGYFDWPVLDEIIDYAARFNGCLEEEGDVEFKPTGRIRLPSKHVRYFGTIAQGSSTPGSYSPAAPLANKAEEEILEKGWITVNYKGIRWVFIPDATLDPDANLCYPEFTIKGARVFRKRSLDKEFLRTGETDEKLFTANEEIRGMKTVFSCYLNSARAIYIARFNYSNVG